MRPDRAPRYWKAPSTSRSAINNSVSALAFIEHGRVRQARTYECLMIGEAQIALEPENDRRVQPKSSLQATSWDRSVLTFRP